LARSDVPAVLCRHAGSPLCKLMEALCFSRNPWKNQSNWEEAQDQIHGLLASIKWQQFLMSDDLQSYQQDLATQRSEPISQRLLFAAVALLPVWARPRLRISRTGNWSASPIAKPSEPLIPWQTQPYRFLELATSSSTVARSPVYVMNFVIISVCLFGTGYLPLQTIVSFNRFSRCFCREVRSSSIPNCWTNHIKL
jgi:hypothetical protein